MTQNELSLGMIFLAAVLVAAGVAADTLVLKDEAYVRGPNVLLGEVAQIEGELAPVLANVDLGLAALPGDSKRLHAALVEARIRNAGIDVDSLEVGGASSVRATTLYLEITREMVVGSLREFIETEMPWDPADTLIDIVPAALDFRVPDGEVIFDWRPNPQYGYLGPGVFRGEVIVDGQTQKRFTLKANVESYGDVLVAAADIPRGAPISASQVEVRKRSLAKVESGAFRDPADLAGYVARTTIFPGQEITKRNVQPRILVKRNQLVAVEMQSGGLRLQTQARALTAGAAGDVILCANLNSRAEFQGIVRADGVVVVP
ncbi:MAG TPA: flagellar basal body P-ring formation chaperone FlgA [Candidatus Hydrogenedentes bacterium]|nr:flagellar basal body P-ring formation chaperone FlgA [Candidatus Hydrogenedentota bacterium]HNT86323.1 flagellar basal body P-ring formation chaperone FlgA [Candidatus Hydrogenedentota bacterium]